MNLQWHFRLKRQGDDISDPISGEFFADGSLDNPATALVREALQNALDAGKNIDRGGGPVHVLIGINRGDRSLAASTATAWFQPLQQHLAIKGSGIRAAPMADEPCDYLVVEDFGTSGLTGDIASDDAGGQRNNFVDFLRSDGRTRKSEGSLGSWGVGKNVFPRSSRINGFIAFTIRHDDQRQLIMGKSILKIRSVAGAQFQPSCYLGASWAADEVPSPYEDTAVIARLRKDFQLKRQNEPGLSLIVPWPDPEIDYHDIQRAVVEQFYFAILAGALSVTLADDGQEATLDQDSIAAYARTHLPDDAPMIELAAWSLQVNEDDRHTLAAPPPYQSQRWSEELVSDDLRTTVTTQLTQQQRVAVRVPLYVQDQDDAEPKPTYFDIYLEHHDGDYTVRPAFFREQLAISGVKRGVGVPKVRALVVINDSPLANLLRAAEPPNHTDWDPKTANFRNAFCDGNSVITFVKSAVKQLMVYVRAGDDEPDPTIAIDFFAMPEPDKHPTPPSEQSKKTKRGDETDGPDDLPDPKPARFTIAEVEGGFVIRHGKAGVPPPEELRVAIAYDVLSGSPWKQYEPADFDLTHPEQCGIRITDGGAAEYEVLEPNRLLILIGGPEFEIHITGFDRNRDLIVRAYDPKESADVDPAAQLHEAEEADA